MNCSWRLFLYCWLRTVLILDVMSRCSYAKAEGIMYVQSTSNDTAASADECIRSQDMLRILENILTGSNLNHLTLITNSQETGCVDLTHLRGVTYVTSCAAWNHNVFWQSASHQITLMTFIIDCDSSVTESIISEFLGARSSNFVEKRLLLPVYNLITTRQIDLNLTLGLDVSAIHFISVVRKDNDNPSNQNYSDAVYSGCSTCNDNTKAASQYEIRKSESGSAWSTVGTYENDRYLGNTPVLRSTFVNFEKMHLKVTHSLYTPFTVRKNGVYSGFCIDLLESIANTLNFTYELIYSIDKKFGVKNSRGTWNGMIGMMERKEVDLIVAGLTITYHREQVVDFTVPFYEETSTVLVRTDILESDIPWAYLFEPLQLDLWLIVIGSVVVFSIVGSLVEQLATYATKQQIESTALHNETNDMHFTLRSSIWLMVCSYAKQGAVALPLSTSGRMSISAFWMFTLMIGWIYNANLTASLTTIYRKAPFNNLAELAEDAEYTILMNGGSVQRLLFEESKRGIYASLWKKIDRTRAMSLRTGTTDALKLLFNDTTKKYAVIGDLTSLKTKLSRDYGSRCDWIFIPEYFFTSGLGIALPDGSPYKKIFDNAVFKALETGLALRYKRKNFYKTKCTVYKLGADKEAKPISVEHIKTILVVTGSGVGLAAVVFLTEYLLQRLLKSRTRLATYIQAPFVWPP